MKTAVQLRVADPAVRCELVHGEPETIVSGALGPIAVFPPGRVVAYLLEWGRRRHLYVFRTLRRDRPGEALVPGVRPHVRLLAEVSSIARVERMRALFRYLGAREISPSLMSDEFYVRVHGLLAGRVPKSTALKGLLP